MHSIGVPMTLAERRVLLGQMSWDHQGFQFRCFLFFKGCWELHSKDVENTVCQLMHNSGKISNLFWGAAFFVSTARRTPCFRFFQDLEAWGSREAGEKSLASDEMSESYELKSVCGKPAWKKVKLLYSNFERVLYTLTSRTTIETVEFCRMF